MPRYACTVYEVGDPDKLLTYGLTADTPEAARDRAKADAAAEFGDTPDDYEVCVEDEDRTTTLLDPWE